MLELEQMIQPWQLTAPMPAIAPAEQELGAVIQKIEDSLQASVIAVDAYGLIIGSSNPNLLGLSAHMLMIGPSIRAPFCLDGQPGELIVSNLPDGETISPRLVQTVTQLIIDQVALTAHLPNRREVKNKFIYDLLHGLLTDETAVCLQAQALGLDLTPPRAVILIDAAAYILAPTNSRWHEAPNSQIRRRAEFVVDGVVSFFHLPNDTICAYLGEGQVAILKASDTHNLATWMNSDDKVTPPSPSWANLVALKRAAEALLARLPADTGAAINISVGRYHPGIAGLARSYQDACAALSLGRRLHSNNQVYCLDALGIAAFVGVADEQTKIDLAAHLLTPLDYEPELLETLVAFFASDCCPSIAASQLSIHRNTLSYRLDKITTLTGLDPRRFDDAVQLRLALMLRSFRSGAPTA